MLERSAWTTGRGTRFATPAQVDTLDLIGRPITVDDTLAAALREAAMTEAAIALHGQAIGATRVYEGRRTVALTIARPPNADGGGAALPWVDVAPVVEAALAVAVETVLDLIRRRAA